MLPETRVRLSFVYLLYIVTVIYHIYRFHLHFSRSKPFSDIQFALSSATFIQVHSPIVACSLFIDCGLRCIYFPYRALSLTSHFSTLFCSHSLHASDCSGCDYLTVHQLITTFTDSPNDEHLPVNLSRFFPLISYGINRDLQVIPQPAILPFIPHGVPNLGTYLC